MARRFAGRRKPRVVWLPTFGVNSYGESGIESNATGIEYNVNLGTNGIIVFDAAGLTWDGSESSTFAQDFGDDSFTLNDFVDGQSYRLRRIVGKFWCSADTQGVATNVTAVEVAFGFIIARTAASGAIQTDFSYVNPLAQDSAEDPWIWRRSWLISPELASAQLPNSAFGVLPNNNIAYGSVADGPHIDQKTARVISRDERLVGVMAAQVKYTKGDLAPTGNVRVAGYLDYRLLASMRKNIGNRHNTSR